MPDTVQQEILIASINGDLVSIQGARALMGHDDYNTNNRNDYMMDGDGESEQSSSSDDAETDTFDFNFEGPNGVTPLGWASFGGHLHVTRYLIESTNAEVDWRSAESVPTPLQIACAAGHAQVARYLINKGADVNVKQIVAASQQQQQQTALTPFSDACGGGHLSCVRLLIENHHVGYEEFESGLLLALINNRLDVVGYFLQYEERYHGIHANFRFLWNGRTLLSVAASFGRTALVELLLQNGANVNLRDEGTGETPLFVACLNGRYPVVSLLLEYGSASCINLTTEYNKTHQPTSSSPQDHQDHHTPPRGMTPLLASVMQLHTDVALLLLTHGADPNCSLCGFTPLFLAIVHGSLGMVQALIDHGARILEMVGGVSSLHVACRFGHTDIVKCLLEQPSVSFFDHVMYDDLSQNDMMLRAFQARPPPPAAAPSPTMVYQDWMQLDADGPQGFSTSITPPPNGSEFSSGNDRFPSSAPKGNPSVPPPLSLACQYGHLDVIYVLIRWAAASCDRDRKNGRPR
mmetsp:Transcript_11330/g.23197  ORF Transcript_11330/g.23197 Transcript_11330/m.23197 type:complete len:520 (-) Transcript_11330:97-1656(-)|eukprot:CAMPEP_0172465308 /NCGR_PEP_ID=MMETSP1065-20121228/53107_1 /TAXON_ID=265537 /ORGANISM="Amphiprora paludosa, Strain CCMP125" /LENGTH=519 /DNA_ID=CAMNT_0013221799 /DNA_START=199 /DNA_END=1758 /DNA_ORIENTATION=-